MSTTNTNYGVDWGRLLPQLLPSLLRRGPRLRAWLAALLSPLSQGLYLQFLALVADTRRQLSYNGQTILLEAALNDRFDPNARRIVVRNDDTEVQPQYLFFEREGQPLPPVFFRSELPNTTPLLLTYESEQRSAGFTVWAPTLNRYDLQLNVFIRRLKLALTSYRIFYVSAPPQ